MKREDQILGLHLVRNFCTRLEEKVIAVNDSDFPFLFGFSGVLFKGLYLLTVNTDMRCF